MVKYLLLSSDLIIDAAELKGEILAFVLGVWYLNNRWVRRGVTVMGRQDNHIIVQFSFLLRPYSSNNPYAHLLLVMSPALYCQLYTREKSSIWA